MPYYGAVLADVRVAVDGHIISAAGVTAGLDAALALVSLLSGDAAAQESQLAIEYAPNPIFDCGTPETAPAQVLESFQNKYEPIGTAREKEAMRYAAIGDSTRSPVKVAGTVTSSLSNPNDEGPSGRSG
jgi:cyclohexyl-isocyanide hydratase